METPATYPSIWQSLLIVGIVILMPIACSPLLWLGAWMGGEAAAMVYYLSGMGFSFYIVHSIRKQKLGASNYDFRISSWRLVTLLALGSNALLFGVAEPISGLIPIPDGMQESMQAMSRDIGLRTFVCMVLAAPLLEELIFRGIMLDGLLKRYTPLKSIVISSLLFGLVHLNRWQFAMGFVLGCFLGWVYFRSGSISACILIHIFANFSSYLERLFVNFDTPVDRQGGIFAIYGGGVPRFVAVSATLLIVLALSVFLLRREFDKDDSLRQMNSAA